MTARAPVAVATAEDVRPAYDDNTFDVVVGHAVLQQLDQSSRAAALEAVVDLHTFDPGELARTALRAGTVEVSTTTEELTAAFLGRPVRTVEAAVRPGALGWGWASFAFGSWKRLSHLDRALSDVVPQRFYDNVGITGVKPS